MAFGDKDQLNEDMSEINNSFGSSREGSSAYGSGTSPKPNIDEDIEKNLLIRTMPRKFKVSAPSPERSKNKTVGAVIMVVGLLVMGAAVYLVYIFLINPKTATPVPVVNKPVVTKPVVEAPKTEDVKKTDTKVTEKPATSTPLSGGNQSGALISTTTTPSVSSSTVPIATSTPVVVTSTAPVVPLGPIVDTDNDSLSDAEEILLGVNPSTVDSDGDGYSDKSELEGLYDPAGAGRLAANSNITQYKDSIKKYTVLYPTRWRTQVVGDSVILSSPDNSFVQVVTESNPDKKSILTWYNEQFTDSSATLADVVVKNGWEGLYLKDKQIFYLTDLAKNNIYTFSYVPEKEGDMTYYNVFQMIINSFSLESK
jgi:hypothetical protein